MGGLWADALTDMSQFVIQVFAGVVMLVAVMARLRGCVVAVDDMGAAAGWACASVRWASIRGRSQWCIC